MKNHDITQINFENILIGNFMTCVGWHLRDMDLDMPFSINLYQQSGKNDTTVGDLFGRIGGFNFIIEFKKNHKLISSELNKPQRGLLLESLRSDTTLRNISKRCHWLCYPKIDPTDYVLSPYTSLKTTVSSGGEIIGIKSYLTKMENGSVGCSIEEIKRYFDLLKKCAGNSSYSPSGILVNFSKVNDGLCYTVINDLNVLTQKISMGLDGPTQSLGM